MTNSPETIPDSLSVPGCDHSPIAVPPHGYIKCKYCNVPMSKFGTYQEITQIHNLSTGMVVPPIWVRCITFDSGKPHMLASLILSYLSKNYTGELFQVTYKEMVTLFGATKKQVTHACNKLENMHLITRYFKVTEVGMGRMGNNIMFVQLNADKINSLPLFTGDTQNKPKEGTMQGFVYLAKANVIHHSYKIGASASPKKRIKGFFTVKMPFSVDPIHKIPSDDMLRGEATLHKRFEQVRGKGEWFDLTLENVIYIQSITGFFNSQLTFEGGTNGN